MGAQAPPTPSASRNAKALRSGRGSLLCPHVDKLGPVFQGVGIRRETGVTVPSDLTLLTARRDLDAAKRFFRKALKDGPLLSPDRIGTDGAATYPGAIAAARKESLLSRDPVHHVTKHLQQGIESDHFRVKKPMPKVGGFRSFNTARRSIQGFEAMLWLRKGFGFAGGWTVVEQNRMLGFCFGLSEVNEA